MAGCQLDSYSTQSWVSHVGYFHEGTGSASARRLSITATGVHGEMYLDIVLVYYHQQEKRTPETNNKTTTGETGGETSHAAFIARYDRSVMGHILDSCTVSASYEVNQAQKELLLMPRTVKGASTSADELNAQVSLPTDDEYPAFRIKSDSKSTRVLPKDDGDQKRTTERILRVP